MEFYQELLLTALVSLLLAFLLGKIAAPAAAGDAASVPAGAGAGAVLKRSRTAEKRVRFREPAVEECEELLPKDLGSDAVKSEVAVGEEFGKENMLSITSTEEVEIEEANVEPAVVESVEFDIEAGIRVGEGYHELEGESVIKTLEIAVTGNVDAMVEMLVSVEPDLKVESGDWDVNQVNEAGLEGEMVVESSELLKGSVAEVESGDRDASQGSESVVSELLGGPESSTPASEQSIEFRDASQVNAPGLEGELVIESPAILETTEFDAESARDVMEEEIIELPKSLSVVCQLDIEKNSIPVVSQVKEAGLELEIKNANAESAICVAEREETIIIRSPESGGVEESDGVEESGGVESVESLLHGEDEWEGIQRSDVEKLFGVAASYTNSTSGVEAVSRLSSDAQMELYGLHKVATEGPCYEPQPLALMVTARAKW